MILPPSSMITLSSLPPSHKSRSHSFLPSLISVVIVGPGNLWASGGIFFVCPLCQASRPQLAFCVSTPTLPVSSLYHHLSLLFIVSLPPLYPLPSPPPIAHTLLFPYFYLSLSFYTYLSPSISSLPHIFYISHFFAHSLPHHTPPTLSPPSLSLLGVLRCRVWHLHHFPGCSVAPCRCR